MFLVFALSFFFTILAFPQNFNLLFRSYYMPHYSEIKKSENRRVSRKEINEDKKNFLSMISYVLVYVFVIDFAIIYFLQFYKIFPLTYALPLIFSFLLQKYYKKRITAYKSWKANIESL